MVTKRTDVAQVFAERHASQAEKVDSRLRKSGRAEFSPETILELERLLDYKLKPRDKSVLQSMLVEEKTRRFSPEGIRSIRERMKNVAKHAEALRKSLQPVVTDWTVALPLGANLNGDPEWRRASLLTGVGGFDSVVDGLTVLSVFPEWLEALVEVSDKLGKPAGRRGREADIRRYAVAWGISLWMKSIEIRPTQAATGKYAEVLRLLLPKVGYKVPEDDIRPLLRKSLVWSKED